MSTEDLSQETLFRIRKIIKSRRILIEPFFKDYDKTKNLHVSQCQMRRVFSANSILLTDQETRALHVRYGDDLGFDYWKFLQEINEVLCGEENRHQSLSRLKLMKVKKSPASTAVTVIEVFAKIRNQVTRNRINIEQFLSSGKKLHGDFVSECKFRSGFAAGGIFLDDGELDILCKS
jgi:hypothetical protein